MTSQTLITGFDPEGPFAEMILPPCFRKRQAETRFKQEWKISSALYNAMMDGFKGPRFQRGAIGLGKGVWQNSSKGVVLNAHTFFDIEPTSNTRCAVQFRNNGNIVNANLILAYKTFTDEWWAPGTTLNIGDDYEVRALSSGKSGTWSSEGEVDDIWATITGTIEWAVTQTMGGGTKMTSATFEVGYDGEESVQDSATIACTAESTP